MNCIELNGINKHFEVGERKNVLKGISLHINSGEMIAIMGPSGSGKSTLLNILGLLDRPTSGTYYLEEKDTNILKEKERAFTRNKNIGFVFQNFNLINELSALENVKLNLQFYNLYSKRKVDHKEALRRSKEALIAVGLEEHINKRPLQLSGGQQQRVAIARAIVNNPAFILADEPTGALDSSTTEEIMQVFKRLHQQGNTLIIVTHNKEVAKQCDRIIEIKDGEIVTSGKREDGS
ncbi:macrolide ABC transporter ATP-binding protein [Bacillus sp. FJAT-27225]|uniref:ABC transporter ATP-binding protein n=1 Tax=Bacillus sp. FJAT-27225 TaxID=1743144 RepID=UPI00080C2575|nr:ABC transporter ATP-binding protein [Bacillus sp. FJAT-27225]OCA84083.1 macrolide ABC transporter ATP-binding protein [Bacillus sp. FJAT-27225]